MGTEWLRFTDHFLFDRLFEYSLRTNLRPSIRKKVQQIINGHPMTQVASEERFCTDKEWKEFIAQESRIPGEETKEELARRAGVDPEDLAIANDSVQIIEENAIIKSASGQARASKISSTFPNPT